MLLLNRADSGYVNVYKWSSTMNTENPLPDKAIGNLVTGVNSLCFHPSNEILCLASSQRPDAVRLVCFPNSCHIWIIY